ncbi:alpha/beta hydrolase [Microbacterium sp. zg-Y818]|uniref:alpha/beta fold hydrolase n=1 Tax=unclassified Microbacterium TaxID=2609290 RepID=UPI00214AB3D5|nr:MULTISPECIES: alpha/beta hydrolase [unclassified Microbacterium]MCR2799431.1 alpha/beta hydrolase [Microbacterium sp. zg.Y818]WIM21430.1 alpha/beta hydrolase [Microbacterium sp. zg-Y818]
MRGSLHFRVVASGTPSSVSRPPMVLVHGIGMSHRYLTRLHDVLAADGTVFSIDLPGYGGMPKPDHDVDVAEMAAELASVVNSLDIAPAVLVGHSMGAQWVVEAACQSPESVAGVVVIGPVSDDRHRTVPAQAGTLALDTLGESPITNAIVFTDYLRCGVPYYLAQVRHMVSYPIEQRVGDLAAPLLIIRGEHDPIAGLSWCRRLAARARDAAVVMIPGGHHVAHRTAPKAVASAIVAHIGVPAAV